MDAGLADRDRLIKTAEFPPPSRLHLRKMFDKTTTGTKAGAAAVLAAASFIALSSGPAKAQAIRCENIPFTNERVACYYYRASIAPGPSCLIFCPPQPQQPAKRVKHRRVRR